jgi:hypothetical protein
MLVHASNRATVDLKSIQTFVFLYHYWRKNFCR